MPTIADYCGIPLPDRKIDGKSIRGVIDSASASSPHDALHWESSRHWAVRQGDWKLVHNGPATERDGQKIPQVDDFLSNMSEDVTETKSISDAHPEIVERLTRLHEDWTEDVRKQ